MYGGPTLASSPPQHGLSAMDIAASAQGNDRAYYRPESAAAMSRPGTSATARTSPLNNRSNMNGAAKNTGGGGGADGKNAGGISATGLIRLILKKPMGIVFEPMEDPHNPSQQRGVRICDLPRTGAAAMSGQLEIGDELLSINNKTMSRLTFDEIMDFIIEADAENVNLLFRRPKKEGNRAVAAAEASKRASNVKWVDNSRDSTKKEVTEIIEPEPEQDETTIEDEETLSTRSPSPPKSKKDKKKQMNKRSAREEESIASGDDTFYTEATDYTEETRQKKRKGRRSRKLENESFLDMLIDNFCAPVIGEKKGDYSDDDETYNSADDETYGTYDDSYDERRRKWNERKRRDKEMREKEKSRQEKKKNEKRKSKKEVIPVEEVEEVENFHGSNSFQPKKAEKKYDSQSDRANERFQGRNMTPNPPPPPPPPVSQDNNEQNFQMNQAPDMMNMNNRNQVNNNMNMHPMNEMNMYASNLNVGPQNRFNPNFGQPKNETTEESLITDPNCPIKELEYDDRVDHAAEVSVMDSIGGPSLLLENLRNASKIVKTVTPEVIQKFGGNYPQELGLTREESIQVDPKKFYRYVVKNLLETHEPEKIRLIDKLFEKYKGREEHLIHKLNARYNDDEKSKKSGAAKSSGSEDGEEYEGFKAFGGGDFSASSNKEESTKGESQSNFDFGNDGWPATIGEEDEEDEDINGEEGEEEGQSVEASEDYTEGDYESVDGTSPEVIAQVSELLNYVYGKTSVPGQIDRVSTIMRAYEGRTGVLLELLETKALLKANADTENAEAIPESLRSNPGLQNQNGDRKDIQIKESDDGEPVLSPISNLTGGSASRNEKGDSRRQDKYPENDFDDDYENKPVDDGFSMESKSRQPSTPQSQSSQYESNSPVMPSTYNSPSSNDKKKKKKGFFGIFKKKKGKKDSGGAFPSSEGGFKKNKKGALLG